MRHLARLLMVEDERVIALDLQHRVTRFGYTVVTLAATGPEAIHQALEHRPDLVLMDDIHLQGEMDGVEAVQFIQAKVRNRYCWRTYFNVLRPTVLHGIFKAFYLRRGCTQGEISGFSGFANSIGTFDESLEKVVPET